MPILICQNTMGFIPLNNRKFAGATLTYHSVEARHVRACVPYHKSRNVVRSTVLKVCWCFVFQAGICYVYDTYTSRFFIPYSKYIYIHCGPG
jgi:hypothetical protein